MRLNYVSILKGYQKNNHAEDYIIRGELDSQPTSLWLKYFQLLWISTPFYRKLCQEPQFCNNDIILHISNSGDISLAIDALKSTIRRIGESHVSFGNPLYIRAVYEAILYEQTE